MSYYVYRPWEMKDISEIAQMMSSHPLWQHYGVSYLSAVERLEKLWVAGEQGFTAENLTEAVVGFILFSAQTFGNNGYIRLFGVDPHAARGGIGQALLQHVECQLNQQSIAKLLLLCTEWNYGARLFYEKMGFLKVGELPNWVVEGTTEVIYAKNLLAISGCDSDLKR